MLLEVKGKQYKIIVSYSKAGVQFIRFREGITELAVHPQIPKQELLAYLHTHHARLQKKALQDQPSGAEWIEILLFDQKYIVKEDHKVIKPFVKDTTILTPNIPKTLQQVEQLKLAILQDQILERIGIWEERLGFMLNKIAIKSLRTKDYRIAADRTEIAYAKNLSRVSIEMLSYIVANSVFAYLALDEEQQDNLYSQYVKDWKHLAKIRQFERMQMGKGL